MLHSFTSSDTVNTASRMESNGERNRIHVSQDTADLLREAGLGGYLVERPTKIEAKGKGLMQTYFVDTKAFTVVETSVVSGAEDYSPTSRPGTISGAYPNELREGA